IQPHVRYTGRGVTHRVRDAVVAGIRAWPDPGLRQGEQLIDAVRRVPDLDLGLARLAEVEVAPGVRPRGHRPVGLRVRECSVSRLSNLQLRPASAERLDEGEVLAVSGEANERVVLSQAHAAAGHRA